ncbi:MAG: hypothetical protein Q4F17_00455 [Eubacteriales bacterium]|nr:hypothetical protein [Eubacteriales bacterium]
MMKKFVCVAAAAAMLLTMAGCSGAASAPPPTQTPATVGAAVEQPQESTAAETAAPTEPTEAVPAYYEEQPDIPTLDSVTPAPCDGKSASGPMESGKYLELCFNYRTNDSGSDNTEAVLSAYVSFVTEQGLAVREVSSPEEYAALNADYHRGPEDEKELYHILKDGQTVAVVAQSAQLHRLSIFLLDAWAPGERPDGEPKDTAFGIGTVYLSARKGNAFYDLQFTDGQLVSESYEDEAGKGGYGGDSAADISYARFYGMTVEEVTEQLQNDGYAVFTGDDLYEVMMKTLQ